MSRRDGKPRSARNLKREAERAADKLLQDRRRLAALEAGGSSSNPLPVESASLFEPLATAARCLRCDRPVRLHEHRVVSAAGEPRLLREVQVVCPWCGEERTYWMRMVVSRPS